MRQCPNCGRSLRARSRTGRERRVSVVNAGQRGAPCPHCGVLVRD